MKDSDMKKQKRSWLFIAASAIFIAAATYYLIRDNHLRFKEQVQLANGEIIEIDRTFKAQSLGEIGGPGGWEATFNSFVISRPARPDNPPIWQSDTGLIPMVFDRDPQSGEWFVVATFYTCEAWYRLGRPKLPYAEFRLRDGQWQKVELSRDLIGRAANVLTTISSEKEPALHTLTSKRERMSDTRIAPKYLKVLDHWSTHC